MSVVETETKVLSTEFFAFFQGNRNHQETRMIFLKDIESHGNHLVDSSFNGINVYCSFRVLIQ